MKNLTNLINTALLCTAMGASSCATTQPVCTIGENGLDWKCTRTYDNMIISYSDNDLSCVLTTMYKNRHEYTILTDTGCDGKVDIAETEKAKYFRVDNEELFIGYADPLLDQIKNRIWRE